MVLLDHGHGILEHGQGPETQEIHFQKSQLLQCGHCKLGGDGAVGASGQGHVFVNVRPADDHSGRMHGRMPGKPLQPSGHVDELMDLLVGIVKGLELRIFL